MREGTERNDYRAQRNKIERFWPFPVKTARKYESTANRTHVHMKKDPVCTRCGILLRHILAECRVDDAERRTIQILNDQAEILSLHSDDLIEPISFDDKPHRTSSYTRSHLNIISKIYIYLSVYVCLFFLLFNLCTMLFTVATDCYSNKKKKKIRFY